MKLFARLFVLVLLLGVSGAAVASAEGGSASGGEEAAAPAAPSAEEQAKMAEMQKRMTPGPEQKVLEALAGNWTYTSKFWMPDGKVEESAGTTQAEMIYGGRFLKETVKGTWAGQPFEGVGITGYDNVKGEYTSVWYDNMATGIMHSTGSYDEGTKTLKLGGMASCPMTGIKDMPMRSETLITDNAHHTMKSFATMDGKESQGMEINSTRAA
jgi:hypothetical protein